MRLGFSSFELFELLKAWVAVSLAFAILHNRGLDFSAKFGVLMAVSAVTVGIGFLLHELAHKVLAVRFGCRAEFRSFDVMLLLAVAMSFFGFIFAAPGAVFIEGRITRARNGIVSAVGPLTNMFLAIVFLLAFIAWKNPVAAAISFYGFQINSWLALFNLLPLFGLDGTKVFAWNRLVYFSMLAFSFLLAGVSAMV